MLDLLTLQVGLIINILFTTAVVVVNWRLSPNVPGVYEWAMGRILTATSVLIYALKPVLPVEIIVLVGNAFLFISYYIIYNGSRRYMGLSALNHRFYSILIVALILYHAAMVLVFDANSYAVQLVTILYCVSSFIVLNSSKSSGTTSAKFQAYILGLHGLFYLGAAVFIFFTDSGVTVIGSESNMVTKLTFLEGSVVTLLTGMMFVAMTAEYLNSNLKHQKEREEMIGKRLKYEGDVKNKFFSIIAHDLKSPFSVLLGMTQTMSMMANSFSKDKLIEYSVDVNKAGERVYDLVHNLLDWSRLQMEGVEIKPENLDMRELAQECIDIQLPMFLEKNIELTNLIEGQTVFADRDMVKMIMRNIVANSLKFTEPGGKVDISAGDDNGRTRVTITDTGVGMSTLQMNEVFKLDQETSTTGTAGETGTGLGLPLCKEMIERNGGEIFVNSMPGKGCEFYFVLPVQPAAEITA